jgi:hypothetical protein
VVPEWAWDAVAKLACPKVELAIDVNNDNIVRCFHKFGCVMGECNECPKWSILISAKELECTDYIKYCAILNAAIMVRLFSVSMC